MECVEKILQGIEVDRFFDSHYVVSRMIHDFSDDYLAVAQKITPEAKNLTLRTHQQIGHLINKFDGLLVKRQAGQSWSENIHGASSSCALWKRI